MACDFHTHKTSSATVALYSVAAMDGRRFCSLEKHPWHLTENFVFDQDAFAEELAPFDALGEVGLDRHRGADMIIQTGVLKKVLPVAQEMNKPVVFHIVRAWEEFFSIIKPYRLKMMLHGFCGSAELLKELWRRNIIVSFHKSVTKRPDIITSLSGTGKFGFESDDDQECDIAQIIGETVKAGGRSDMEQFTDAVFQEFVNG
jgi:TatD DNase family protein